MSSATDQLKEEHKDIKLMLKILQTVADRLHAGEPVPAEDLDQMVDFIVEFADKCHHGKEEDHLFVAMEHAGIPKEGGPIAVMLTEHGIGRDHARHMRDAAALYRKHDPVAGDMFASAARSYAGLLASHIDKEDMILYPMADRHLSEAQQAELLKGFDRVEEELIGPARHEQLERTLETLADRYLRKAA